MINCERVQESISRLLDGELSPPQSASLQEHLSSCPQCSESRRQLEKIQSTLKEVLNAQASELEFTPFWRGIQDKINRQRVWYQDYLDWGRSVFSVQRVAWGVPVVIILVLGLLSIDFLLPDWRFGNSRNSFVSVDSIDTHGHNVALLREDETKTTVIWLYQDREGDNETADETVTTGPAF